MHRGSKTKSILLSVLFILACISFTRTVLEVLRSSKKLDATKSEIAVLEERKSALEKSIEEKKTDDYIEKTARNELNLIKPGEEVFVVKGAATAPESEVKEETTLLFAAKDGNEKLTLKRRVANIGVWLSLFF